MTARGNGAARPREAGAQGSGVGLSHAEAMANAGTTILRQRIALMILRDWGGSRGYDSRVALTIEAWIDASMKGPVPWPRSPLFEAWAEERGLSNIDGFVGYRTTVSLTPSGLAALPPQGEGK